MGLVLLPGASKKRYEDRRAIRRLSGPCTCPRGVAPLGRRHTKTGGPYEGSQVLGPAHGGSGGPAPQEEGIRRQQGPYEEGSQVLGPAHGVPGGQPPRKKAYEGSKSIRKISGPWTCPRWVWGIAPQEEGIRRLSGPLARSRGGGSRGLAPQEEDIRIQERQISITYYERLYIPA